MNDVVCYDFGSGVHEEHPDFDIKIFEQIIDTHDEEVFWNGLVDRLVVRALEEKYGAEVRKQIENDPEHLLGERDQLAERLRTLIERDGIYAPFLQPGWAMPDGLLGDSDDSTFDPRLN